MKKSHWFWTSTKSPRCKNVKSLRHKKQSLMVWSGCLSFWAARHRTAGSISPSHCGQRILRTWLWFPQTTGDRGSFPLQLDNGHPSKECQIGKHRGTFLKLTMDQEIRVGNDWSILLISSGAALVQIQFLYTCFSGCMNNYMTNDTCKSTLWFQVLCSFLQPAVITDAFQIGLNMFEQCGAPYLCFDIHLLDSCNTS
jgi:hypothetical protein